MLSAVLHTIRARELALPGERILVAVSGGPDSMALLHALWEVAGRLGVGLEVATVDHGLRPEARAEAELVRARAAALDLPWHGVCADVAAARKGRPSLQDAARRARLAALTELAARLGAGRIALGHQADDQAETVLFRVVRGTGLRGLGGIPYLRGPFIRPLLDVTRAEVLRYLRRRSIPFVEDPSNADHRFARARIRHRLLPLLAEENPRIREALVALAAAARDGAAPGEHTVPADIGRRAARVIERLQRSGTGTRRVDVSGRRVIEVAYGRVRVHPPSVTAVVLATPPPVAVRGPGRYTLDGGGTSVDIQEDVPAGLGGVVSYDADALAWPLSLRTPRPGDRMRPRGGRGSRKLSDLLIDAKIGRARRPGLPVLTTADDVVLFVAGLRPAERGRPSPSTTRFIHVSLVPPLSPRPSTAPTGTGQTSV
jgi:tRNA(Ile)-lysidine synthase